MTKELQIIPPEGYEIDKENSTLEKIVFKKIDNEYPTTWKECLLQRSRIYFIDGQSCIIEQEFTTPSFPKQYHNSLPNKETCKQILALCQLLLIKDVYNEGISTDNIPERKMMWGLHTQRNQNITIYFTDINRSVLIFYKEKAAREFLKNFRELILEAAPLL